MFMVMIEANYCNIWIGRQYNATYADQLDHELKINNEPSRDKIQPGPTQTGLYSHRSRLEI